MNICSENFVEPFHHFLLDTCIFSSGMAKKIMFNVLGFDVKHGMNVNNDI